MEAYQQPLYVTPTGPVVSIVATTSATTTSTGLRAGLYYVTNSVDVYLNVDSDATKEVQNVLVTPVIGNIYELTVDTVVLTSAALVAATYADLVTKLQADVDYAAAPFTIAANGAGNGLTITWKEIGAIGVLGSLVETEDTITAVETTAGDVLVTEVQDLTCTANAGYTYTLVADGVTLTSAALTSSTLADLVTKLQADGDYAGASFTIAENVGVGITITWNANGAVAGLATLVGVKPAVSATETTAGVDGVATSSNMFLLAGDRVFDVPQGTYISCLRAGASDGVVSITRCS